MKSPNKQNIRLTLLLVLTPLLVFNSVGQSLWKKDVSKSMYADLIANQVGDVLNVIIQEQNNNKQQANTTTAKNSSINASIQSFLYPPSASGALTKNGRLPAMNMDSDTAFKGGGQISNSKSMSARIAVIIVDKMPNGLLLIEGRRMTEFSGERQEIILQGIVREKDITGGNTVFSYNIANAKVQIVSKGAISQPQKKGWFTKTWDKISPF